MIPLSTLLVEYFELPFNVGVCCGNGVNIYFEYIQEICGVCEQTIYVRSTFQFIICFKIVFYLNVK